MLAIALHNNAPNPLATIEILHAAQRLNNPGTPNQAVFEIIRHSETEN